MPPRNSKRGRKRTQGASRRRGVDTTEAPSDMARYAIDLVRKTDKIVRLFNTEDKMFDENAISISPTTTPVLQALTTVRAGTSVSQRVGNSIRLARFSFRASFAINTTAGVTTTLVRFMIVSDMNNNGTAPTAAELLEVTTNPRSAYNKANLQRFAVISDKMIPLSTQGDPFFALELDLPLNFHIYYDGDSGTAAMFRNNNMWLVLVSDQLSNAPSVQAFSRIHYVDD